ncbi:hypothetical protein PENTCL1PPCAC_15541, partial [Pristionchus entomophagus]
IETNLSSLPFNFHWDRDFALSYVHTFQKWFPIFTLITIHPLIFYVVLVKSVGFGRDVMWGFIANQICLLLYEFNVSFLYRMVNLIPYAGLYCDGPLCRMGLPKWVLMRLCQIPLSLTYICSIPTSLFMLLRFHQMIVANSNTNIRFSKKTQAFIIIAESFLLLTNVFGFAYFGRDSDDSAKHLELPELEWLTHLGGTIFMFGPPGYPQYFMYEGVILLISMVIIAPFVTLLIIHSTAELRKQVTRNLSSSKTHRMKNGVIAVFYAQMIGILVFMWPPLECLFYILHLIYRDSLGHF